MSYVHSKFIRLRGYYQFYPLVRIKSIWKHILSALRDKHYDILSEAGCEVDIWRTTYYHQMPSHQAIIDWVTATGLRPWLQDLTESEQQHFLTRYHQMLEEQYPLQENGQILLAFPRLFIVARRTE